MNDNTEERKIPEHHTSTAELVVKYEESTNPVTKAVYRSIIASRLGITERQEMTKKSNNLAMRSYLDKCTFSFSGRSRMEDLFDLWFMK
jgi:hypothetical protein